MKNIKSTLLLAAVFACALSCETPEPEVADRITLVKESNKELGFDGGRDSRTVALKANVSWTASSDMDWCQVSPSEGLATDTKLKISVDANESDQERTAVVTVAAGEASLLITVTQGERLDMSLDEVDYLVEAEGGSLEVTVTHNVAYEVRIPEGVAWISEVKSKKMSVNVHEFVVEPNEDTEPRVVEISFVCDDEDLEETVKVAQKGAEPKPFIFSIFCDGDVFVVPSIEGEFTGTVFWDDVDFEEFGNSTVHEYGSAEERTVTFELYGDPEDMVLTFPDLVGVTGIDLSELPAD